MTRGLRVLKENDQTPFCLVGALGPGVPHIINTKLLKQFTCLTYNNGRSGGLTSWLLPIKERAGSGGRGAWIAVHVLRVTVLKWALLLHRVSGKWV